MSQISNNIQVVPQLGGAPVGQSNPKGTASTGTQPAADNTSSPTAGQGQGQGKEGGHSAPGAVDKAVVQINDYMQYANRSLEFSIDKSTGQTIIKVVDQTTGQTLQQIPPEYAIKLAQTLLDNQKVSSIGIQFTT